VRPYAIGALQMDVHPGSNLDRACFLVRELVERFPWVEMVLLSELAVHSTSSKDAVALPGPEEDRLCALAKDLGIWLIPGSIYERDGDKIFNTTPIIDPSGTVIGRYRKMFPFQPYEPGISAGDTPFVFDVPGVGRFGVSICYDMWFPETVRWLVAEGAEVILHPALTDTIDRDVELAIVRATAAQNQCFVIDVNGAGHGGSGRSNVVGPAGDVLHLAGAHEEEIPVEIDLDRVSRSRELGLRGLGQPLKSLRDRAFEFPHYAPGARSAFFDSLGPLKLAERGSRKGIQGREDHE
jgi:predicted amidohydrolase